MNVDHIYRIGAQGWQAIHAGAWRDVPPWPKLPHPALVVLDLDEVTSEVWRFEGKPEYARALIEKRVRTEGLTEGNAHIVVHKLIKSPNGFQAFFSALDIDLWQRLSAWAGQQADHCMLMTSAGLLCSGLHPGQGRVLASDRQLSLFVLADASTMVYASALTMGQGLPALEGAAQLLAGNARDVWRGDSKLQLELSPLWLPQQAAALATAAAAFAQASGVTPAVTAGVSCRGAGGDIDTMLPTLAARAAAQQALNPGLARMAWRAETWVSAMAALTAVVGVGLVAVGLFADQVAQSQQRAAAASLRELQQLEKRIQAVSRVEASGHLAPVAEFAQRLDSGARNDPIDLLATLKAHAGSDVRIQRVKLEPGQAGQVRAYRVDGVAALEASGSVVRLVNALQAAGWTLKAIDPVDSATGAFSYELVAKATAALH